METASSTTPPNRDEPYLSDRSKRTQVAHKLVSSGDGRAGDGHEIGVTLLARMEGIE